MDVPEGVLYVGLLLAVSAGMTAWRVGTTDGRKVRVQPEVDRWLGACLIAAAGLFVAVLLPCYLPGYRLP
jgi:hypothetical protein